MSRRVFVSHSSQDRELVVAVVDLLREGLELSRDEVFCSSLDGYGVPLGSDTRDHIKNSLGEATVAVSILTNAYLKSEFCKIELAAIWSSGKDHIPIEAPFLAPPEQRGSLLSQIQSGVLQGGRQCRVRAVSRT